MSESLRRVIRTSQFDNVHRTVTLPRGLRSEDVMGVSAALTVQERGIKPSTTEERKLCFLKLAAVYPPRDGEEAEERTRFNVYHDALRDIPADLLWEACMDCVKTIRFFPQPSEIRGFALPKLQARLEAVGRLRALRDYRVVETEDGALTEEQRARRKKLADELRGALAGSVEEMASDPDAPIATVRLDGEPEVNSIATAILRSRMAECGVGEDGLANKQNIDFLKKRAIADARFVWPWLRTRGWKAPEAEGGET